MLSQSIMGVSSHHDHLSSTLSANGSSSFNLLCDERERMFVCNTEAVITSPVPSDDVDCGDAKETATTSPCYTLVAESPAYVDAGSPASDAESARHYDRLRDKELTSAPPLRKSEDSEVFHTNSSKSCGCPPTQNGDCLNDEIDNTLLGVFGNSQQFSPGETLIIFDWDDTLCPSSWLSAKDMTLDESCQVPAEIQETLDRLSGSVCLSLKAAKEYGRVVIVTNAEEGWVQLSAMKFMPSVMAAIKDLGVAILSARTEYESPQNPTPVLWKIKAFTQLIDDATAQAVAAYQEAKAERKQRMLLEGAFETSGSSDEFGDGSEDEDSDVSAATADEMATNLISTREATMPSTPIRATAVEIGTDVSTVHNSAIFTCENCGCTEWSPGFAEVLESKLKISVSTVPEITINNSGDSSTRTKDTASVVTAAKERTSRALSCPATIDQGVVSQGSSTSQVQRSTTVELRRQPRTSVLTPHLKSQITNCATKLTDITPPTETTIDTSSVPTAPRQGADLCVSGYIPAPLQSWYDKGKRDPARRYSHPEAKVTGDSVTIEEEDFATPQCEVLTFHRSKGKAKREYNGDRVVHNTPDTVDSSSSVDLQDASKSPSSSKCTPMMEIDREDMGINPSLKCRKCGGLPPHRSAKARGTSKVRMKHSPGPPQEDRVSTPDGGQSDTVESSPRKRSKKMKRQLIRNELRERFPSVAKPSALCNVLQFGDSESERVALFEATKCISADGRFSNPQEQENVMLKSKKRKDGLIFRPVRGKSFKFAEQPTTDVLEQEHVLIYKSFEQIIYHDGNLDWKINIPAPSECESGGRSQEDLEDPEGEYIDDGREGCSTGDGEVESTQCW